MNVLELTSPEIQELDRENAIVFLPIGTTEQHGPHLPMGTKGFIAETLAFQAGIQVKKSGRPCLVAPTLPYSTCQISFKAGPAFSIGARVFSDLVYEIGQAFFREGFRNFFVVNTTISPENLKAISVALDDLNRLEGFRAHDPMPSWILSHKLLLDDYLKQLGINPENEVHADVKETSALLYLDEEMVKKPLLCRLPPVPVNLSWETLKGHFTFRDMGADLGYIGSPGLAQPEIGKLYIEEGGEYLAECVQAILNGEALPGLPIPVRMFLTLIDLDES
jgi:creatinine amidohydrolase